MRLFKSVAFVLTVGLALPALASATTLNVAPGAPDDAGNVSGCSAQPGGSFGCVTLRDAIAFANAGLAGSSPTVQLAAGTYTLSTGALSPTVALSISGTGDSGQGASTIRQTGPYSVLAGQSSAPLTLTGLVVTGENMTGQNGTASGGAQQGVSAIAASGSLTLGGVAVIGNHVAGGAGFAPGGSNQNGAGAAVLGAIFAGGSLSITNSIVSGNTAIGGAGGSSNGVSQGGPGGAAIAAVVAFGPLSITNSTFTNNSAIGGAGGANTGTGFAGPGGVALGTIFGVDSVSITGSTFSGNSATGGAGGAAAGANAGAGAGGLATGIAFAPQAASQTLAVTNSTITGDTASGGPGGTATAAGGAGGSGGEALGAALALLSNASGPTASIVASTIANNTSSAGLAGGDTASSGAGGLGGIASGAIDDATPIFGVAGQTPSVGIPLSISASTLSGNQAAGSAGGAGAGGSSGFAGGAGGGALRADAGSTVTIVNSTVFANSVQSAGGMAVKGYTGSFGGGLVDASSGTSIALYSDTIAGNSVSAALGGQWISGPDLDTAAQAAISLEDTAVVSPSPAGVPACGSQSGTYTDLGHNLQDSASSACGLGGAGMNDQLVTSSGLPSALAANGGPTMTLAPKPVSALIGNGGACTNPLGNPASSPLTADQRFQPRGPTCDIGAFQTQPIKLTGTPQISGTGAVGNTLTCAMGTLAATGDGIYTAGAIGARQTKTSFASNGTQVSRGNTYTVSRSDQGHSIACTITVIGAYGQAQATSAALSVAVILALSHVSEAHPRWAEKKTKHGPPMGTTFTYALNTPATVTLTFTHKKSARKIGQFKGPGSTGKHAVHFNGRVGRHRLAPGSYTVAITATTATATSTKKLSFTIA